MNHGSRATLIVAASLAFLPRSTADHFGARTLDAPRRPAAEDSFANAWREDLDVLVSRLTTVYPRPYARLSREQVEEARDELREKIPQLSEEEIVIEMMRLTALMLDGHSRIYGATASGIDQRWFPVRLYEFSDGLFVRTVSARHADAAGARVLRIGGLDPAEALQRVESVIPGDNTQTRRFRAPYYMMKSWILHGLGIIDEPSELSLVVEGPGDLPRRTLRFSAVEATPNDPLSYNTEDFVPGGPFVRSRDASTRPLPSYLQQPDEDLWFTYMPQSQTLYARMNRIGGGGDEGFDGFVRRLWEVADSQPVENLVLDLRFNRGGNKTLAIPLLHGLIRRPRLDRPGHLFTLVGRKTFSAGMMVALMLEEQTHTLFVGEPTGASPNFVSETRGISLPNSGLVASVGVWYWVNSVPWDTRPWLRPDVAAPFSSSDYRNNVDPAVRLIVRRAIDFEALADSVVPRRRDELNRVHLAYRSLMAEGDRGEPVTALELRDIGRALQSGGDIRMALDLFDAWVKRFPDSSDALLYRGRAYLEAADTTRARADLQRAMKLAPDDPAVRDALESLH